MSRGRWDTVVAADVEVVLQRAAGQEAHALLHKLLAALQVVAPALQTTTKQTWLRRGANAGRFKGVSSRLLTHLESLSHTARKPRMHFATDCSWHALAQVAVLMPHLLQHVAREPRHYWVQPQRATHGARELAW